jgi:hypothetical protein
MLLGFSLNLSTIVQRWNSHCRPESITFILELPKWSFVFKFSLLCYIGPPCWHKFR